jgi:hypothetical protein
MSGVEVVLGTVVRVPGHALAPAHHALQPCHFICRSSFRRDHTHRLTAPLPGLCCSRRFSLPRRRDYHTKDQIEAFAEACSTTFPLAGRVHRPGADRHRAREAAWHTTLRQIIRERRHDRYHSAAADHNPVARQSARGAAQCRFRRCRYGFPIFGRRGRCGTRQNDEHFDRATTASARGRAYRQRPFTDCNTGNYSISCSRQAKSFTTWSSTILATTQR